MGDGKDGYVIDAKGGKAKLSRGSSDAALTPDHVERSKLFALDRLGNMEFLDAARVAQSDRIHPIPVGDRAGGENAEEGSLVRAADLIGQLGDPHYLRKANALYYEFEEVGMNRQLGYGSPADLTDLYPQFYYNSVAPHIQTAIRYLNVTSSGRQWIASLYSNVFRAESELSLSGPEWLSRAGVTRKFVRDRPRATKEKKTGGRNEQDRRNQTRFSSARSPYFSEEHELLRAQVRRSVETEIKPKALAWEEQGYVPREVLRRMGSLGFFGIRYPARYGGSEMDALASRRAR